MSVPTEDVVQRHGQAHLLAGDGGKPGGRSPGNQGPLVETNLVLGCLTVENLRTAQESVEVRQWELHLQLWRNVRRSTQLLSQLQQGLQQLLAGLGQTVLRLHLV